MNGSMRAHRIQKLSSSATWMTKFVLPAVFIGTWPVWLIHAWVRGGAEWIPFVFWGIAFMAVLIWTRPIKKVTLEGDEFVISNYFNTHRVPISHFRRFTENRMNRTPTIDLHFDPPTPFGRQVRIVPPRVFSTKPYDDVVALLRSLILRRSFTANSEE